MKEPTHQEKEKCMKIRCAGKRGQYIHPDDLKFLEKIYKKYPKWTKATEREVFERTKPFGAR
jgi:hypothetical protein